MYYYAIDNGDVEGDYDYILLCSRDRHTEEEFEELIEAAKKQVFWDADNQPSEPRTSMSNLPCQIHERSTLSSVAYDMESVAKVLVRDFNFSLPVALFVNTVMSGVIRREEVY